MQPEFLGKLYAFFYPPAPSQKATEAWLSAPGSEDKVDIWVMQSPPKGRLDAINVPLLVGYAVQIEKIAKARPLLCVFGHYHFSWRAERVRWTCEGSEDMEVQVLAKSQEQEKGEAEEARLDSDFEFSGLGNEAEIEHWKETVFVNAAWMTMRRVAIVARNPPFSMTLRLSVE